MRQNPWPHTAVFGACFLKIFYKLGILDPDTPEMERFFLSRRCLAGLWAGLR